MRQHERIIMLQKENKSLRELVKNLEGMLKEMKKQKAKGER